MPARPASTKRAPTWVFEQGETTRTEDFLATEEPLEIRIVVGGERHPVAVTMRTPGSDFELAAGFLFTEGAVRSRDDIGRISYCVDEDVGVEQRYNIVTVDLAPGTEPDLAPLERHFSMTSACGVCGKSTLEALRVRGLEPASPSGRRLSSEIIQKLPDALRAGQTLFHRTGGLHAAGLFSTEGELVAVREDVGRHNAMDKLIGWALLENRIPMGDHVVMLSGRSSFELVQKSLAAGVPVVCSVSAPSSLAADLAREFGMTLVGFVRDGRFNVYSGIERLELTPGG